MSEMTFETVAAVINPHHSEIGLAILIAMFVGFVRERHPPTVIAVLVGWIGPFFVGLSPIVLLFAVYLCSSLLTEAVSNNAVAVIMTPIAIGLGSDLGVDPCPLVIAVMFAASASFATLSYQTNTMVYAAGNYRFMDFVRIGLPMNLVVGLTTCITLAFL